MCTSAYLAARCWKTSCGRLCRLSRDFERMTWIWLQTKGNIKGEWCRVYVSGRTISLDECVLRCSWQRGAGRPPERLCRLCRDFEKMTWIWCQTKKNIKRSFHICVIYMLKRSSSGLENNIPWSPAYAPHRTHAFLGVGTSSFASFGFEWSRISASPLDGLETT
jgi:hypothetical protein